MDGELLFLIEKNLLTPRSLRSLRTRRRRLGIKGLRDLVVKGAWNFEH